MIYHINHYLLISSEGWDSNHLKRAIDHYATSQLNYINNHKLVYTMWGI